MMDTKEMQLEIATLRSAILEVAHRFEKLHTAVTDYECPKCANPDDEFPNRPPKTIFTVGNKRKLLTPTQTTLIEELIRRPGQVVTYDRIIYVMWESGSRHAYQHDGELLDPKTTLSAHLCNLRKRLSGLNCKISTHWGAGLSIYSDEVMSLS